MSGQHSNVDGSFTRRAFARLIDLCFVLGLCCLLYLANWLAGFPVKYTALFDARAVTSLDSFMTYNLPGVALRFISVK